MLCKLTPVLCRVNEFQLFQLAARHFWPDIFFCSRKLILLCTSLLSLSCHFLSLLQFCIPTIHYCSSPRLSFMFTFYFLSSSRARCCERSTVYRFSLAVRPFVLEPVTHGNHLLLIENQPDDESIKGVMLRPQTIFISSLPDPTSLARTHTHTHTHSHTRTHAHTSPRTNIFPSRAVPYFTKNK